MLEKSINSLINLFKVKRNIDLPKLFKNLTVRVLKFGGTSVGTPERMQQVARIISKGDNFVVLSAVSGTTNSLVEVSNSIKNGKQEKYCKQLNDLKLKYIPFVEELINDDIILAQAHKYVNAQFEKLEDLCSRIWTTNLEAEILSYGEVLSTNLFSFYLNEIGVENLLVSALDFMKININGEPDLNEIDNRLNNLVESENNVQVYVTQGFICRDSDNNVSNLKRGGSDYSASLIGEAINAEEIVIWTDIDGMHNNDPRVVNTTYSVKELSFNEAAELAYFGAKILHPQCVFPAQRAGIDMRIKNTMQPNAVGTRITEEVECKGVKAIAAKDNITAIKIKSGRMLMAYGFLTKVFEIFERNETSIDMITTSEVAVSLTIDDNSKLSEIKTELENLGEVEVDREQSIVCVVGSFSAENKGYASEIFNSIKEVPVRMVSYGGSKHNISILLDTSNKAKALNLLNEGLFNLNEVNYV